MIKISKQMLDRMTKKFGADVDSLVFVGGGKEESDGILYSYSSGSKEMVLKILSIPKENADTAFEEMEERTRFVNYLGRQGMDIAYPVKNKNNNIIETIETEEYILAAYEMNRVYGNIPQAHDFSKNFYIRYGKIIGKLHQLSKIYPKWKGNAPDGDSKVLHWSDEWKFFYSWCQDSEVKRAWQNIKAELSSLPVTRDTFGFIHNDPHVENIMIEKGRVVLIDFDVANFHWFMNDIAIASQFLMFSTTGGMGAPFKDMDKLKSFYMHFMNGYETENHMDAISLDKLELFINYRRLLMYTISQHWLESNPEQKKSWKQMILNSPSLHLFN